MKKTRIAIGLLGAVAFVWVGAYGYKNFRGAAPAIQPPVGNISEEQTDLPDFPLTLPPGLRINIFAKDLDNPRVMAVDSSGTLLVSLPRSGSVVALLDENQDGVSDETLVVASGLKQPHGIAFRGNELYLAETDEVVVYSYDEKTKKASNKQKIIDLPTGGNHTTRTIGFDPHGDLYISVGSSCNVCAEKDERRAAVLTANADGSNVREFATGLRNSVFFTWHPKTQEMWATEMGRDLIGDDIPPDEINIVKEGIFYGWPYCYGKKIQDRSFDSSSKAAQTCINSMPSHIDLQAHSAPLGLAFIPDSWPEEYRNDLLVSYHGSWNRSTPTGYKIVRFPLDAQGNVEGVEADFITGWLPDHTSKQVLGRPADLLFDGKGILYISDDKAGVVYGIRSSE